MPPRWPPVLLLLTGVALFAASSNQWQFDTGIDDAHITFFAAHTLASTGEILNYNGERIEQSSSLLHVLLTALLSRTTQLNTVTNGYLVPLLAGWLCLPLLWHCTRRTQLVPAVLLCATLPLVYWTHAGLETALFALLLLLHFHFLAATTPHWLALAASGLTLQMTRPELPIFVPVLTLAFCLLCRAVSLPCRSTITRCLLSIIVALCIVGWRWLYFGDLFPQPVTAKVSGITVTTLKAGLLYLCQVFTHPASAVIATCCAAATLQLLWRSVRGQETSFIVISVLACVGYTLLAVLAGGDWMPHERFLAPLVPLQALLVTRSLCLLLPGKAVLPALLILAAINFLHNSKQAETRHIPRDHIPADAAQYSFFERHSPDHQANLPTLAALIPLVAKIQEQKKLPVQLLSGQMGLLSYHLSLHFPGQLRFTDRNALVERSLTECSLTRKRPRAPQGLDGLAVIFFIKKAELLQQICGITPPDIIFDLWLHGQVQETRTLMEKHGYATVHVHEGTTMLQDQLILVRQEWLKHSTPTGEKIAPN